MSALPRPELLPGPQRDLVDALHDLHHRAGWPSLRSLAEAAGCSHTTVSKAFSAPRLPSWGLTELLVEAMGGDPAGFRTLWLAATASDTEASPSVGIAGRQAELATVGRHLQSGSGLLVVAGEAGVGKTRLVTTAADAAGGVLVIRANCLPLATEVPLLPWAEALQQLALVDDGRWLRETLAGTPAYVSEVLGRLVPDLAPATPSQPADDSWRQRLFLAVATVVSALHSSKRWALLLEDLHWADLDTLDLLEHLLVRGSAVPVLGTWRLDDPDVRPSVKDWWTRRARTTPALELGPLTRDETAAQLELLTGRSPSATDVDHIHARTLGLPLYTEQLAVSSEQDQQVPRQLDDLLVQRLGGLSPEGWAVAAALGAADRDVDLGVLQETTELDDASLSAGLRELTDRYLLSDRSQELPQLRHPLLAEAVRRRLLGPESTSVHRRLAAALGRAGQPAAEVAEHWQRAGDRSEELHWRIGAAIEAGDRFAEKMEWTQWHRVLDLWPDDSGPRGPGPGVTLVAALTRGCDATRARLDLEAMGPLAERLIEVAAGRGVSPRERADALASAGMSVSLLRDTVRGRALYEESVRLYRGLEPTRKFVQALAELANMREPVGEDETALDLTREAVEVAERLGDEPTRRQAVAHLAWHEGRAGHHDAARTLMLQATDTAEPGPPDTETGIAIMLSDLVGTQQWSAADAERAGRLCLEAAAVWDLDGFGVRLVRANLAETYLASGLVERATLTLGELPEDVTDDDGSRQLLRARIECVRGQFDTAGLLLDALGELPPVDPTPWELVLGVAELEVWRGEPGPAGTRLEALLGGGLDAEAAPRAAEHLLLLARARADQAELAGDDARLRREAAARLRDLARQLPVDPLGEQISPTPRKAWRSMWQAELSRLDGTESAPDWAAAAGTWDVTDRPHRAAYCRWRAARVALAQGQGTIAARLLKAAARDARGHVPLSTAITETAAYAAGS